MADEYISKQSVIDYLNGYLHSIGEDNLFDSGQRRALTNAIQDISAIKAADVQPVKHGHWISKGIWIECSNCKKALIRDNIEKAAVYENGLPEYCPRCGAKMDLKDGESNE